MKKIAVGATIVNVVLLAVIGAALALAFQGCTAKPSVKAASRTRMIMIDTLDVDRYVESKVLRDTKTDRDYLLIVNFHGGVFVTPLLGPVEEGE